MILVAVLLAAVCGIGLGFSALTARTAGSTVLTFLTVAALTLLTPILFGLTYPSISRTQTVEVSTVPQDWTGEVDAECEVRLQRADRRPHGTHLVAAGPQPVRRAGGRCRDDRVHEVLQERQRPARCHPGRRP